MCRNVLEKADVIFRILASVVTICGIIVIVWQARVAARALEVQSVAVEAQVWQSIGQEMSDITKIFIEHPELYDYFEKNKELKSNDKNYAKVISVADLYLDYIDKFDDGFVRGLEGMEDGGKYWTAWRKYFLDQFRTSPALRARYTEVKSWYPPNGLLAKLSQECDTQRPSKKVPPGAMAPGQ